MGNFCGNICGQKISKTAQTGHTDQDLLQLEKALCSQSSRNHKTSSPNHSRKREKQAGAKNQYEHKLGRHQLKRKPLTFT